MAGLEDDLCHILEHTGPLWEDLRGKSIFLTGGTGFFGTWFLESFVRANTEFVLNAKVLVLTRDAETFKSKVPQLAANPAIDFHIGDIRSFEFPSGRFSHVIHAATTNASATFHKTEDLFCKYATIVDGTRRALDFAVQSGAGKFLLLSSGPVYGRQPANMVVIPEDYLGAPSTTDSHFDFSLLGEAKRVAELFCSIYAAQHNMEMKIARCFSFVGPHLPLDLHYAIGNFIADVLKDRPIHILGDGTPLRSYLYMSDLMIWLWTLLLSSRAQGVYNVGSEVAYSITDIARLVAGFREQHCTVTVAKAPQIDCPAERYIPSTQKAQQQLGLKQFVDLRTAIKKTLDFYSNEGNSLGK